MKLLAVYFSSASITGPNIFFNTVLKHPQSMIFLQYQRPTFTPKQNNRQNYNLHILIFVLLYSRREDKIF
jgi:hypothetical protein